MATFKLSITTPEREVFNSDVQMVIVRTVSGDVGIMAGHENYIAPLDVGIIKVKENDNTRRGVVSGGFIKADKTSATVLCATFEWEDEIDLERAAIAEEKARKRLANEENSDKELQMAKLKLKRSVTRQTLAGK